MKLFEEPIVEVVKFAVEDVITESVVDEEDEPALGGDIGGSCV